MADRSKSKIQEIVDRVLTQCPEILRTRWCPMRIPGAIYDTQNTRLNSKFGGNKPFRPETFKWPLCNYCEEKKSFVFQLNIETLPLEFQDKIKMSSGLLQLFYCFRCMPNSEDDEDFRSDQGMYSNVNIVQKTEFVPSLMSLAAEAFAKQKSYNMNVLPHKLREYVETLTETAPETGRGSRERVVINWRKELEVVDDFDFEEEFAPNIRFLTETEKHEFHNILTKEYPSIFGFGIKTGALEHWSITHDNTNVRNDHCQTKIGGWMGYCYSHDHEWPPFSEPPECPECGDEMDTNFLHENGDWFSSYDEIEVYLCSKCLEFGVQVF